MDTPRPLSSRRSGMATTADEHTSLIKRPDFRSVSQRPRREPCGPCARLCTRERLVSVVCGKKDEDEPVSVVAARCVTLLPGC